MRKYVAKRYKGGLIFLNIRFLANDDVVSKVISTIQALFVYSLSSSWVHFSLVRNCVLSKPWTRTFQNRLKIWIFSRFEPDRMGHRKFDHSMNVFSDTVEDVG